MRAKYLLRFDDICPTMNWEVWSVIEKCILDAGIKPILAVVPDNRDQKLVVGRSSDDFWERVRTWQSWGWCIGLHGYQHCYVTNDAGLMRINPYSEFAGLSLEEQSEKLDRGLQIFRDQGVRADIWVAPAHSFDAVTISALQARGIRLISDGFTFFPFRDRQGALWIPQQLWRFRSMPFGVWTVCSHHNAWTNNDMCAFRAGIDHFGQAIISVDDVVGAYGGRVSNSTDIVASSVWPYVIRLKRDFARLTRMARC